ncbi:MAG: VIT1/CCC1 transporter family protein [Elusimicrobiota bacterium]
MNKARYIIRGLIDGCLSVMGVIIGAYNPDISILITAAVAGTFANGFSNMLAAFSAEQAFGYGRLRDLEESMLISLKNTTKEKELERRIKRSTIYDGIFTIVGGFIPLTPFFFFIPRTALISSIAVTLLLFAFLGVYTAKISKLNILYYSIKMVFFAIVTASACFLVRYLMS